ncbi:MAG: hypothetical protein AMXMBFR47_21780 [Planctomycetota bacterium]
MECAGLAEELRCSITEEEVAELHRVLTGLSVTDWIEWRDVNMESVCDFVASTPSQRKAAKFKKSKLVLTMAGVQHCLEAEAILRAADEHFLEPGGPYREMAARAGRAFDRLFEFEIPNWPFDSLDTPFRDDHERQRPGDID